MDGFFVQIEMQLIDVTEENNVRLLGYVRCMDMTRQPPQGCPFLASSRILKYSHNERHSPRIMLSDGSIWFHPASVTDTWPRPPPRGDPSPPVKRHPSSVRLINYTDGDLIFMSWYFLHPLLHLHRRHHATKWVV